MNEKAASMVDSSQNYKGIPFPFSFILAPKGKRNYQILKSLKKVGELIVESTFKINPKNRLAGLGLYYDKNRLNSIFDECKEIEIDIKTLDEYVYCDTCKTLASTHTCPHGQHHHVHYHSDFIMQLIQSGLVPPSILVRKEVSANILTALFTKRFENLQELHYSLMHSSGLLEQQSEEQFYLKLIKLYQTSSLT